MKKANFKILFYPLSISLGMSYFYKQKLLVIGIPFFTIAIGAKEKVKEIQKY